MGIRISNSNIRLKGSFIFNKQILSGIGALMRIVGLLPASSSIAYIDINGDQQVTPEINIDSPPLYFVALSGSVSSQDEAPFNFFEGVYTSAIINTLITGSTTGSSFTEQLITTPGSGNWTKPTGVTQVIVECWGGGGAGGGAGLTDSAGSGGAGGQYARKLIIYPTASQSISYVVANTAAGISGGTGTTGEDTTWGTNVVVAKGGPPGQPDLSSPGIGTTTGGIGDVVYKGGDGEQSFFSTPNAVGGSGGSGAGSAIEGINFSPKPEYGGSGGAQISGTSGGSNGNPGSNYGAGGGGCYKISGPNRSGGDGAQGLIRLIYR